MNELSIVREIISTISQGTDGQLPPGMLCIGLLLLCIIINLSIWRKASEEQKRKWRQATAFKQLMDRQRRLH